MGRKFNVLIMTTTTTQTSPTMLCTHKPVNYATVTRNYKPLSSVFIPAVLRRKRDNTRRRTSWRNVHRVLPRLTCLRQQTNYTSALNRVRATFYVRHSYYCNFVGFHFVYCFFDPPVHFVAFSEEQKNRSMNSDEGSYQLSCLWQAVCCSSDI